MIRRQRNDLTLLADSSLIYQTKDIAHPSKNDVLCGRGGFTNIHPGNTTWRKLVSMNKSLYLILPKLEKTTLSKSIVRTIRGQQPSGRFLIKDKRTNLWTEIGNDKAILKTTQELKEGVPKMRNNTRKQNSHQGETSNYVSRTKTIRCVLSSNINVIGPKLPCKSQAICTSMPSLASVQPSVQENLFWNRKTNLRLDKCTLTAAHKMNSTVRNSRLSPRSENKIEPDLCKSF